jgi:thiol-disulfide isomerase/thioredoxin
MKNLAPTALLLAALPLVSLSALAQQTPAASPAVDPKADAVLERVEKKMAGLKSLSAAVQEYARTTHPDKPTSELRTTGTVRLLKPNYGYYEYTTARKDAATGSWKESPGKFVYASDGNQGWLVPQNARYIKRTVGPDGKGVASPITQAGFFGSGSSLRSRAALARQKGQLRAFGYQGKETWEGASYDVVSFDIDQTLPGGKSAVTSYRVYVGADDLPHRVITDTAYDGERMYAEYTAADIKADFPATPADFAYTPPAGAKSQEEAEASRPKLLAVGTPAPDFTVTGRDGKPVKLSDLRGKVVVLDFWATWCGPCLRSFPHTSEVAKKTADKGAVVFAVNVWDEQKAYEEWLPKNPQYDHFLYGFDPKEGGQDIAKKLYNVSGIPTQYVIGKDGKIAASFLGYGGPTDALEKAILAAAAAP